MVWYVESCDGYENSGRVRLLVGMLSKLDVTSLGKLIICVARAHVPECSPNDLNKASGIIAIQHLRVNTPIA